MLGSMPGDGTPLSAALLAGFVALAAAVAELRQAQQHTAQAAAARTAAQQLYASMTKGQRPPEQARGSRQAPPGLLVDARVSAVARLGFPSGLVLPHEPVSTGTAARRPPPSPPSPGTASGRPRPPPR
jgi:hypothetical protein